MTAKRTGEQVASALTRKPRAQENRTGGLTLDDYLYALADMRRTFKLEEPSFDFRDIEREAARNQLPADGQPKEVAAGTRMPTIREPYPGLFGRP